LLLNHPTLLINMEQQKLDPLIFLPFLIDLATVIFARHALTGERYLGWYTGMEGKPTYCGCRETFGCCKDTPIFIGAFSSPGTATITENFDYETYYNYDYSPSLGPFGVLRNRESYGSYTKAIPLATPRTFSIQTGGVYIDLLYGNDQETIEKCCAVGLRIFSGKIPSA
jgi:hypothetical protein